ncbi:MAG: cyclin-like protein [Benjaminiella poitrasii]|nr:MAG: cyclin-like protein [Benjaminiella poitrasii]
MSGSSPLIPTSNTPTMTASGTTSLASQTSVHITTGLSFRRHYRPYFTKRQLTILSSLKKTGSFSAAKELNSRQSYCKFIQDVGKKLGFPQKTISTSQALFHRFYLYYSLRDYAPQDISATCLFVASKIEETHKKLKDIMVVVHSVRYPDSKELDPEHISEERRRKIIGYEKLLLEVLCFDFQLRHPYEYVIKFIKWIQAFQTLVDGRRLARKAYDLAVDSYRTPLCLEYPAHTIAAGCIMLASRLLSQQDKTFVGLSATEPWDQHFLSRMEDMEDVCQQMLDLYIVIHAHRDHLVSDYTKIKIELNKQAQERGPDPVLDDATKEELGKLSNVEFNAMASPLDTVNTNQHTVSYHFSTL